jgi:hypothetical protein
MVSLMKGDSEGTKQWAEGALWTSVATHTLKFAVDEERPNGNDNNSFPSGHTSAAFQGAAFLQMRYGWEYGVPAYAAASFVGYSRVHGEYHYWRDVAAGAALAPFLAMLESIKSTGTSHPVHLIYGVTYDSDLVEMEKLEAFASSIDNVTVSACVASEKSAWPQKGYVTNHIDASHLNNGDVDIYLCGPPPMVEAVSHFMKENNIVPANFYYEKFAASSH